MLKHLRLILIITPAIFAQNTIAGVLNPSAPNAGSILQEIQPNNTILTRPNEHGLTIEAADDLQLPETMPFKVLKFNIIGNQSLETEILHSLVVDKEGQDLTLRQLGEFAALITAYYHSHNYPLALALIPAQTIEDGAVTIQVLEASYGDVLLENKSRVAQYLLDETLKSINSGDPIEGDKLNQTLLLLNDIPGIVVDASIKKGDLSGTSDLIVNTADARRIKAYVSVANSGSASIGRNRANANLDFFNPLGFGDVVSINGLTSGSGMNYGRLSYELLINGHGTRIGGGYSNLYYQLGQQYKALKVHGTSTNYSLWAKQPLFRGLNYNLYTQLEYDHTILRDHIDFSLIRKNRSIDNFAWNISGDARDTWLYGGMTYFNMSLTSGNLGFDDAAAAFQDLNEGKTQGSFSKLNVTLSKTQQLTNNLTLSGFFSGQWANDNLDSSQKMVVGGPNSVRAYDASILSGDNAQAFTAELRRSFNTSFGLLQATVFYDAAHLEINTKSNGATKNSANIQGVGLGLNWQNESLWSAHLSLASPVGAKPALLSSSDLGSRLWAEVRKDF